MTTRNPVWVEQDYRFYRDDAVQASATALANQNTAATVTIGTNFRLVVNIGDTNNANSGNTTAFKCQFRIGAGSWTDVGAATAVRYANSSHVADNNNYTTQRLNAITGSTYTSARNAFDSNNTLTSQTWADQYCEYEFCLLADSSGVSDGNSLTFRVVTTAGTVPTITNTPTATAAAPVVLGSGGDPAPLPSLGLLMYDVRLATLAKTLDDVTKTITATNLVSGSLLKTLDTATVDSTATNEVAGTLAKTLDDATVESEGAVTAADNRDGFVVQTLEAATATGTVTVDVSASLTKTLDAATLVSTGGPSIVGSLAKTLADVDPSAAGVVGNLGVGQGGDPAPIPSLGLLLDASSNFGSSESPAPFPALGLVMYLNSDARVASLTKTLEAATLDAEGYVPTDEAVPFDFDAVVPLAPAYYPHARNVDWWTGDVQVRADTGGAVGVVDNVLAAATSGGTGTVDIVGTATPTLAAATSTTAVNVTVAGSLAKTLEDATVDGLASVDAGFVCTLSQTLQPATVSTAGGPLVDGRVVKTLASVTVVGRIDISGGNYLASLAKTLAPATVVSVGAVTITGGTTQTLGSATVDGEASVLDGTVAALTKILADAAISAAATSSLYELGVRRRYKSRATEKKIGGAVLRATERDITGETVE